MTMKLVSLLLCILVRLHNFQNANKMILIHGEPIAYSSPQVFDYSWDYCTSYCYQETRCLAAYYSDLSPGQCQIFEIGKISEIQQLDAYSGKVMAVKMLPSSSTQCPLTPNSNSMTGLISTISTYQNYSISIDQAGLWTIQSSPFYSCPENFRLFHRALGFWCIGVTVTGPGSQGSAAVKCAMSVSGVLSGFDSEEEIKYANGITVPLVPTGITYHGYWMDGKRKDTCKYANQTGPDCTGIKAFTLSDPLISNTNWYLWGWDSQPSGMADGTGAACVVNRVNRNDGAGLDDIGCSGSTTNVVINGYICGVKPAEL